MKLYWTNSKPNGILKGQKSKLFHLRQLTWKLSIFTALLA